MYKAREVMPAEATQLYQMVDVLSKEAGIPMPKVYVIPQDTPNAFATGRNPDNAVVAVTNGLLQTMNPDELAGVLAHELGHIAYYHKLNALEFGKWGLCYLRSDEFHVTHERTTDLMPVYHGLGSQIYQYAYYVRNDPSCLEIYQRGKNFMDKYYMTEVELLEVINSDVAGDG